MPKAIAKNKIRGPAWLDKREAKHRKNLITYLKGGGAVTHRESGEIYCSPMECPADFLDSPYSYRKCTYEDLMADQVEEPDNEKKALMRRRT